VRRFPRTSARIARRCGALIGVASAASYLFIVDQPITAADMDALSDPGAIPLRMGGD
jgi:hypothetical protein